MTRHIIVCITALMLWNGVAEGQMFRPNTEVGGFAGTCYYLGDINPRKQFYSPGLSLGLLGKHNFTEHHVLRVNLFYGQMRGNDMDSPNDYQQTRLRSFEASLLDCHVGYEFNFLPYIVRRRKASHSTPYFFAALGYSLMLSNTATGDAGHVTIPFGVGYKYRFNDRIAIGCEWGLRKTFTDRLDGVLNPGPDGSYAATHNNDWYSFAGIFLTFKVYEQGADCPGVKQQTVYK